jgi:hypothetical protein
MNSRLSGRVAAPSVGIGKAAGDNLLYPKQAFDFWKTYIA